VRPYHHGYQAIAYRTVGVEQPAFVGEDLMQFNKSGRIDRFAPPGVQNPWLCEKPGSPLKGLEKHSHIRANSLKKHETLAYKNQPNRANMQLPYHRYVICN